MYYLPYEIREQLIQCIGLCFHFKDGVEAFFISCGVKAELAKRDKELPKFRWARNLLNSLDEMEEGDLIQKRLITQLCKFRNLPDQKVPNRDAGLDALRKLKELAQKNKLEIEEKAKETEVRQSIEKEKKIIIKNRADILEKLKTKFTDTYSLEDRQRAGYILEDILEELFPLFNLEYRKSYKIGTEQIDGYFKFDAFDYLVEAKWTSKMPDEADVSAFKRKVDTKLESTRGVIVSINGVRQEVIDSFKGVDNNIIFIDGQDIQFVLEGIIDLRELLRAKIEKAAQEGCSYVSVKDILL